MINKFAVLVVDNYIRLKHWLPKSAVFLPNDEIVAQVHFLVLQNKRIEMYRIIDAEYGDCYYCRQLSEWEFMLFKLNFVIIRDSKKNV